MCAIESGFVYHANNSENRWNLEFISSNSRAYKYYLKAFIDFFWVISKIWGFFLSSEKMWNIVIVKVLVAAKILLK